jgi:hypothetical protein
VNIDEPISAEELWWAGQRVLSTSLRQAGLPLRGWGAARPVCVSVPAPARARQVAVCARGSGGGGARPAAT